MATSVHRTPKSGKQSLFFQDLSTPISSRRPKFSSPSQAAAVSTLWRENFAASDLPPPPVFTLEDRSDFSPESGFPEYPLSPEVAKSPDPKTPKEFSSKGKSKLESASASASASAGPSTNHGYALITPQQQRGVGSGGSGNIGGSTWWSPGNRNEGEEKGKGGSVSPVEGVVQSGALITLPPPREVARPEVKKSCLPAGDLDEEEWVTVYGFPPGDTNLVLREFEKCGVILKHIPGPRDANWMHVLYQKRADAHKALGKNGMQINGVLIVGVKPVDPVQRQALNERLNNQGFVPLPPANSRASDLVSWRSSPRPNHLQNGSTGTRQAGGAIASPAKSMVNKIMDLMFGV